METTNFWTRRYSRRGTLVRSAGASAGVAALAFLAACSGDEKSGTSTGASGGSQPATGNATQAAAQGKDDPKRGGELKQHLYPTAAQPMDPHTSVQKAMYYWALFGERIVAPHPQTISPIQPELAEKWEQPDASTLILTVRQGVRWHEGKVTNGRALTAEDLAFNIMRIIGKFDQARVAQFARRTLLQGLDRAEATNPQTVRVTLSQPNAALLYGLSDARQLVVAKETVDADPEFKKVAEMPGTGAWVIQSYDDATSAAKYVANKNYWRTGQPYADSVSQVILADTGAAAAALVANQIDYCEGDRASSRIVQAGRKDAVAVNTPAMSLDYVRINQTRGALADARVRRAIHLALNRKELGDGGYGEGNWSYTGLITAGLPGAWSAEKVAQRPAYNPSAKQANITEGAALLTAAGFPKGAGLSFSLMPYWQSTIALGEHAVRIKDQLQKAYPDIQVRIDPPADAADNSAKLSAGNFDAAVWAAGAAPDGGIEGAQHYATGGGRNYTKYSNAKVDELFAKTFSELDASARAKIFDDLQELLEQEVPVWPVSERRQLYWVDPKIRGFDSGPGYLGGLYTPGYSAYKQWRA